MKSKVLLIDDSVTIHRVIDLSIDVDRYDIVKVFSKEDAALKMQSEHYDYILLDNKLDNIIIAEYIKELKSAQPSASIILLVGAFDRFDENDLEKTGADDYLVKPFDSQSLNEKLSSDADMMPAGIVEKIAEADFARDNDDYITPTASLTTGEVIDGLSKKEYLENLEEIQPDDLTDNGYVEDLDAAPSLEFDKQPKEETEETETALPKDDFQADNVIEESPEEDIIVIENNEPEEVSSNSAEEETVSFDQSAENNIITEKEQEIEYIETPAEIAEDENNNIQLEEETAADDNITVLEPQDIEQEEKAQETDNSFEEENITESKEEIEIPDNITAVYNPVLPDIDDAAEISDEYIMQDNLAEVDNESKNEMLDEFPDFPETDDVSTDEMQDNLDIDNSLLQENENSENVELPEINTVEEEHPAENISEESIEDMQETVSNTAVDELSAVEEKETLLVDDDDWLADAPVQAEENSFSKVSEDESQNIAANIADAETESSIAEELLSEDNSLQEEILEETKVQEEEQAEPAELFEENTAEENQLPAEFDIQPEETAQTEEVQDLGLDIVEELSEENTLNDSIATEELPEMPSLDEVSAMAESVEQTDTADESPVETAEYIEENTNEPAVEESVEESVEENSEEIQAEEPSFNMQEEKEEYTAVENQEVSAETALPVQKEEAGQTANIQQAEVKQAETYSPETSGRFGGITVTISRDEIIAMLGNAIDKHFLEEAVKEVIAANMKDIVRNIVPAIAEKYIKEEIERLKNDE